MSNASPATFILADTTTDSPAAFSFFILPGNNLES